MKEGDDVVRVVVVVSKEDLAADSVEAVVITRGAKVIVVGKPDGIKNGVDFAELPVENTDEDDFPCGVNVVF